MNYIKMNDNNSQLSLGNLFNAIKKETVSKNASLQSEIFCILFELKDIGDTTVNNTKKIFLFLKILFFHYYLF